ncbi:MAG: OmpA family protein [Sulfitobacter sp.]
MIRLWSLFACAFWFVMVQPVAALEISLPTNARQTVERNTDPDSYAAPVGVFDEGQVARITIEGDVRRAAWRLDSPGLTPLQVMRPIRAQLIAAGFDLVLDCSAAECGGFDFRFAAETLPGPNMYVNIRAFHFVTALRPAGDTPDEVITVLASTSATSAYVQIIQAGKLVDGSVAVATNADLPIKTQQGLSLGGKVGELSDQLLSNGHAVLPDLDYATGTSDLGPGPFASLNKLADFLIAQPSVRIALVGHTDTVGGLDGNIALSRRRAQSVRDRLIAAYGVDAGRMDAQGMGYLAPVASNLDAAGREANRRVEVIIVSAE